MLESPNALMAINEELRRVEALAARASPSQDDVEMYRLIADARDALDALASGLERQPE